MTPESEDTPGTPEHAHTDTVCLIHNRNEVCANNAITPSPHPTSSDLADKSQDGEDDEAQVTENDASNIPINELKVFVKGKRCKLDFSNCSIELIDELFPKKRTLGTMDPPASSRSFATDLRAWQKFGSVQQVRMLAYADVENYQTPVSVALPLPTARATTGVLGATRSDCQTLFNDIDQSIYQCGIRNC